MQRNFLVVANPQAGRAKVQQRARAISEYLTANQCIFQLVETKPDKKGTETVRAHLQSHHTDLVILGGDGTIHQAINGLFLDLAVSILPCGTGNDTVKNHTIGKTLKQQLDTILNGKIKAIDVGVCNGIKFLNGVGVGFDGQIVCDMLKRKVPLLTGQAKYYYHVLHILASYQSRKFRFEREGQTDEQELILMTIAKGTTFGGGFMITPHARPDDGKLAVCQINSVSPLRRYLNIIRFQHGSHHKMPEVRLYHVDRMAIGANDLLEGHIDGEYLGKPPFELSVLPKALKLRVQF